MAIRPLWRHYFVNTDGVVVFVDSSDHKRVAEAKEEIDLLLREPVLQGVPFLVLANKQDIAGCLSPEELGAVLELAAAAPKLGRPVTCLPTSIKHPQTFVDAIQWLVSAMSERRSSAGEAPQPSAPSARAPGGGASASGEDLESVLQRWMSVEDSPDDALLAALEDCSLEVWDHRTHLRIAWVLLSRHGRRAAMPLIFDGIKNFIEKSPKARRASGRGSTFHETMTYFWVHLVDYAMHATRNDAGNFRTFLLLNPQLADGGLFLRYYSKARMLHDPEARTQVVLPDVKPLPSILSDVSGLKHRAAATAAAAAEQPQQGAVDVGLPSQASFLPTLWSPGSANGDAAFVRDFEARVLREWGHRSLIRVVYCYLSFLGRRNGAKEVFTRLEVWQASGFNVSLAYFWIQMVTEALMPDFRDVLFPPPAPPPAPPQGLAAVGGGEDAGRKPCHDVNIEDEGAPLEEGQGSVNGSRRAFSMGGLLQNIPGSDASCDPSAVAEPQLSGTSASSTDGAGVAGAGNSTACWRSRLPEFADMLGGRFGRASKAMSTLVDQPQLWRQYYSERVLFSDVAMQDMTLPDRKPFASVM
uniref:Uncharacterized protein n=1 Tax=Chlamydomonas euryale TaxID=1486919 RepID=A0A7R9VZ73_9CHLO